LLFGPSLNGRPSFFDQQVAALQTGKPITLFADEWRTPLSLLSAARALIQLAKSEVTGILHLGGPERLSRLEMGQKLAKHLRVASPNIQAVRRQDMPGNELRPRDTSLNSDRCLCFLKQATFFNWPKFEDAIREMGLGG
jgi:dTDP-4-dehydrorhamnose reductase